MKNRKAFTLIELLAVIIILGLLMAIAVPMVTKYINESRKKTYIASTRAFANNKLKSVTIPNSVSSISINAFAYNELSSVTLPSSVNLIEDNAFSSNPLGPITLLGRSSLDGMTLGENWQGTGNIVFRP